MARIFIGTLGWVYGSWKGRFYPDNLPDKQRLSFYADRFATTEVNYSYYHVPSEGTYRRWAGLVPPHFLFALKANRIITHIGRLGHVEESWRTFLRGAGILGQRLGPILVQLPPSFRQNLSRLDRFLELTKRISQSVRLAFEFRHVSWFAEDTYRLLRNYHAAFCIADGVSRPRYDIVTADFAYLRYHGRTPRVAPCYTDDELRDKAQFIAGLARHGIDTYAYFNDDADGHAPANAATLQQLLDEKTCAA